MEDRYSKGSEGEANQKDRGWVYVMEVYVYDYKDHFASQMHMYVWCIGRSSCRSFAVTVYHVHVLACY